MDGLWQLLGKIDNVAVLVLALGCFGLGYLHVIWRREEREDRAKMLDVLGKVTDALSDLKNVISARTGQPL
jgi:hypothetical protein